ncbi:OPT family oligopeptide transporter [Rickettsiella endosymbiont of Dermanyssus gallinae]|uniref:OPT family oligopeptide transporter n=1 Tax=Rickettsiella endosymbiont of Dermanyssus gallinae TaxID=2856608 RepID=UPI001C52DC0D|nr:oligopeptide transporter, OPT family [Rickettsiella endosymbiont of Dermanyssus gallinae]
MQNTQAHQSGMISLRVILLSIFLAILLAASSTYLALKIGILPSASIPAAILAMAILRFFKSTSIYEINLIQTSASAGEAVAGGIVYTIPALVIMRYWNHFPYFENVAIALLGGLLGILFSIPLRKVLINTPQLYFPEAKAIAEVLQLVKKNVFHLREIVIGTGLGALLELAQSGFKVIASAAEKWVVLGKSTIVGFGIGFSPALIGVGYLIGFDVGLSLVLGALLAWGLALPLLSVVAAIKPFHLTASLAAYRNDIHYIGLGAMLTAGFWTLINLLKPFYQRFRLSTQGLFKASTNGPILSKERDIPSTYLLWALPVLMVCIYFLFHSIFPAHIFSSSVSLFINLGAVAYVVVLGFVFAAICGYFSGLVGVTASPGSAILIGGLLLTALILRALFVFQGHAATSGHWLNMAAMTIIIGAVVAGTAAIANDTIQDLKVGHIIGAAPWQQQLMLVLGVIVAALVVPYVMELLFNVYGLTTILPHAGMDPTQTLSAPPAAMMAGLTQGIFNHDLPWAMLGIGALILVFFIVLQWLGLKKLSLLGIAMGVYLPLSSSVPLFIGSLFAFFIRRNFQQRLKGASEEEKAKIDQYQHYAVLLACGLVAGAALMDVVLAIPMSLTSNPEILAIMPAKWNSLAIALGFLSVVGLGFGFYRVNNSKK